jgi:hypothetical protein
VAIDAGAVRALCEQVLAENWREGSMPGGTEFGYTCPSPGHYPWQWYWDSCFAAIAWRHFDAARSERELRTLLAAQRPDGFIGHTIFWNTPLRGLRRHTYNVTSPDAPMTASIQPPLLAWAWQRAVGDPREVPEIALHHDWLERNRELEGDGLIWILQPDESGLDASPQFDPIWRAEAHGLPGFVRLVRSNRRFGYDLRTVAEHGRPVCAEVLTNVLYSLGRTALGRPSLTQALIERCYDVESGLFQPLIRRADGTGQRSRGPVTWAALSPLALPDLPVEIGRRLVEEHLLNAEEFWLPTGVPSVSAADPKFERDDRGPWLGRPRRYWRGPVWVNACWLLWLGMVRLGYTAEADELAQRLLMTIERSGLCEYFEPFTGGGMGQRDFAWSALAMELLEPAPQAR